MAPRSTSVPMRYARTGWLEKEYPSAANRLPTKLLGPASRLMKLSSQASTASVTASGNSTTRPASQVATMDSKLRLITWRPLREGRDTDARSGGRARPDSPRDGPGGSTVATASPTSDRRDRIALLFARDRGAGGCDASESDRRNQARGPGARGHRPHAARRARLRLAALSAARALAQVRARRAQREGARRRGLGQVPEGRGGDLRRHPRRGNPEARAGREGADQQVLRGQSGLSREAHQRLEPLVRARARRQARRRGGAAARIDGLALQPAPHRAALPRPRLCRRRAEAACARHRPGRAEPRGMGRLDGGHAARGPRSAPARGPFGAAASRRLLERRGA